MRNLTSPNILLPQNEIEQYWFDSQVLHSPIHPHNLSPLPHDLRCTQALEMLQQADLQKAAFQIQVEVKTH